MDDAQMIRELRARGYLVLNEDEVEKIDDEMNSATCGCGCGSIKSALREISDPREWKPYNAVAHWPELPSRLAETLGPPWHPRPAGPLGPWTE